MNAFYAIEELMRSQLIRAAVKEKGLELHAAVLNQLSAAVEFIGLHPENAALLDESRYERLSTD